MKRFMTMIWAVLMAMSAMAQRNVMYIEDFEIIPGEAVSVPLMMANSDSTRGCQFNMILPQGLSLVGKSLTPYAEDGYGMNLIGNQKNGVWTLGMYPMTRVCLPPADTTIMILNIKASSDFTGGEIILFKQRGFTIDNVTIYFDNDTATVTVPQASIIDQQEDALPVEERFYNLSGQTIQSPDSVPLAIQVTTLPSGERKTRKVAVRP